MSVAGVSGSEPTMTESTGHPDSNAERANNRTASAPTMSNVGGSWQITSRALYRFTAAALVVSGLSLAIGTILHPTPPLGDTVATSVWEISHALWWVGTMVGVIGLTGLYLRYRGDVGVLGLAGSTLAVLGVALLANAMFFEAFIAPSLATQAPELFESYPAGNGWEGFLAGTLAAGALFGVGFLLFGIALFRAASVPRWAIVLAVLGGVPFAVNFLLPQLVAILAAIAFATGLAGMGYELWRDSDLLAVTPE